VYDPASARIAAEAVLQLTQKILDLKPPASNDVAAQIAYFNTLTRYITIKEQQAEIAKREILILWTDYFKADHLKEFPNLHELVWKATKLCSAVKREVSLEHAQELLNVIRQIHDIFWKTKGREVPWYLAS
jgi:nickel superoxide dismutase